MSELEQAIRFFDNALDHCVMHARKPFEVAIKALCEKLEREKGCEYCNPNNLAYYYAGDIPNYCKHCGRKLKGSDQHE